MLENTIFHLEGRCFHVEDEIFRLECGAALADKTRCAKSAFTAHQPLSRSMAGEHVISWLS